MNYSISSVLRTSVLALTGVLLIGITSAQATTVLLNFNGGAAIGFSTGVLGDGNTWNTYNPTQQTSNTFTFGPIGTLVTSTGGATTITFSGSTSSGNYGYSGSPATPTGTVNGSPETYPSQSIGSYMYTGLTGPTIYTFSGLDLSGNTAYTFTFLSSKGVSDPHSNTFSFAGTNSGSVTLDSANNTSLATVSSIIPSSGTITLTVTNNQYALSGVSGGYLNFIQIDTVTIPEPSTVALAVIGGLGLFFIALRRRAIRA